MNEQERNELVNYRINKAKETLRETKAMMEKNCNYSGSRYCLKNATDSQILYEVY